MKKKTLSVKDRKNLTEEEKKDVLSFYGDGESGYRDDLQ